MLRFEIAWSGHSAIPQKTEILTYTTAKVSELTSYCFFLAVWKLHTYRPTQAGQNDTRSVKNARTMTSKSQNLANTHPEIRAEDFCHHVHVTITYLCPYTPWNPRSYCCKRCSNDMGSSRLATLPNTSEHGTLNVTSQEKFYGVKRKWSWRTDGWVSPPSPVHKEHFIWCIRSNDRACDTSETIVW